MSVEAQPLTEKQVELDVARGMPDSATLEEISEEMAILAAIRESQAAAGQLISHEEVKRRLAAWIFKAVEPDVPVIMEKTRENEDGSISQ